MGRRAIARGCVAAALVLGAAPVLALDATSPLDRLTGRWAGEGRLGIKDAEPESVKCRATYIASEGANELKQTVRCASAAGSIEVQSTIAYAAGAVTGSWTELTHNMHGDLSGQVTERGFRVAVRGDDLSANMDVIVNGPRQIIEIQFNNSSLIGLTLVLTKG